MQGMAIGEIAAKAGIRPSAVRFYESVGLLPVPRRVNRQRRYDPAVLERLALIQLAQQRHLLIALAGGLPNRDLPEKFDLSTLHLPRDLPLSLPSSSGRTSPIAFAAPVLAGMMESAAARIRRMSALPERLVCAMSCRAWSLVYA